MLQGIIDVGSNTVRLTIYKCEEKTGDFSAFFKLKHQLGLVSHIERKTSRLDEAGVDALVKTLKEYLAYSELFNNMGGLHVFATAALRRASNSDEVIEEVRRACGLEIDLIDGKEEARLGFLGSSGILGVDNGVQIDIGGGSSEVLVFKGPKTLESASIPWGSLSLFEEYVRYIIPTAEEAQKIESVVSEELAARMTQRALATATCSGGAARCVLKLRNAWLDTPHAKDALSRSELETLADRILSDPRSFEKVILRTVPERVHTSAPGLFALLAIARHYDVERLLVSNRGVREGYLVDRVLAPATTVSGR